MSAEFTRFSSLCTFTVGILTVIISPTLYRESIVPEEALMGSVSCFLIHYLVHHHVPEPVYLPLILYTYVHHLSV